MTDWCLPSDAVPGSRPQAFTALTYGASGVMYFCYWSPAHVFKLGGGLLVPRGTATGEVVYQRGPHWYEPRRITKACS